MFLAQLTVEDFRCFGEGPNAFVTDFRPGLTALVGANDAGKTAVIDALRLALGTSDQEWSRIEDSDFNNPSKSIRVICRFDDLEANDLRAFPEYLVHGPKAGDKPSLFLHWTVENAVKLRKGRAYRRPNCTSGRDGKGPEFNAEARLNLLATYLRPLRDAEAALTAGRGSRLAQVLRQSRMISKGTAFDPGQLLSSQKLSILSITQLLHDLLNTQEGIKETGDKINETLGRLSLIGDDLTSAIRVNGANLADDARLRELLEKLDLRLAGKGKLGLGSDNLLFMACELLLLSQDDDGGNRMLLIEEPEAHLHAQRQLQVMRALQVQAKEKKIQIITTTHSPNLCSAIELENLVLINNRRGFPLSRNKTMLDASDYKFLARFLDSTKANLFFAKAVMIVEGDGENILLPVLARLLGRGLTENGVSIVNVGGTGLSRYSRIFRRQVAADGSIGVPVACISDLDVWPNCAPEILGKLTAAGSKPPKARWKTKSEFANPADLAAVRTAKCAKNDGENVKTFVSDEWTFEYDITLGAKIGTAYPMTLAKDVFVAIALSRDDEKINEGTRTVDAAIAAAETAFDQLEHNLVATRDSSREEVLATTVYEGLEHASKPVAAQYMADLLQARFAQGTLNTAQLRSALPKYIVDAIDYVTKAPATA